MHKAVPRTPKLLILLFLSSGILLCSACNSVRYMPFSASETLWSREPSMEHGAASLSVGHAYIYSIREGGLSPSSSGGSVKGGGGCGCQ